MSQPKNLLDFIKDAEKRAKDNKENQDLSKPISKIKDKSTFGLSFFKIYDILATSNKDYDENVAELKRKAKKDKNP